MKEAKEFFYSDKIKSEKWIEAHDGGPTPGIHRNVASTQDHFNKALEVAYLEGALDWMSPYDTGCSGECRKYLKRFKDLTGKEFPDSPLYLD